jgi:hypothetical protein
MRTMFVSDIHFGLSRQANHTQESSLRREAAARERWRNLPPVRLRGGTNGPRTEQEEALADRLGY